MEKINWFVLEMYSPAKICFKIYCLIKHSHSHPFTYSEGMLKALEELLLSSFSNIETDLQIVPVAFQCWQTAAVLLQIEIFVNKTSIQHRYISVLLLIYGLYIFLRNKSITSAWYLEWIIWLKNQKCFPNGTQHFKLTSVLLLLDLLVCSFTESWKMAMAHMVD